MSVTTGYVTLKSVRYLGRSFLIRLRIQMRRSKNMTKILCPSGLWVSEDECESCGQCRPNEKVGFTRKEQENE